MSAADAVAAPAALPVYVVSASWDGPDATHHRCEVIQSAEPPTGLELLPADAVRLRSADVMPVAKLWDMPVRLRAAHEKYMRSYSHWVETRRGGTPTDIAMAVDAQTYRWLRPHGNWAGD